MKKRKKNKCQRNIKHIIKGINNARIKDILTSNDVPFDAIRTVNRKLERGDFRPGIHCCLLLGQK